MIIDAVRKAFLFKPKQIVILTDGIFEMSPQLLYQVRLKNMTDKKIFFSKSVFYL